MPRPKSDFDRLHPCDFYEPDELLDPDRMYTVYEIARLLQELDTDVELEPDRMYTVYEIARMLQELDPDAEIEVETEEVLLDWAIPWIMTNADDLVVGEPRSDDEPGYYGLDTDE